MLVRVNSASAKAFLDGIDEWFAEQEVEITRVYRGLAVALFNYVAWETPQWTGTAASNWNMSYGYPSMEVDNQLRSEAVSERGANSLRRNQARFQYGTPVAQKGDSRAVTMAALRNAGSSGAITGYKEPIFISNNATGINGESYASMLEANPNNYLRAVNEPGHMAARGVVLVNFRFPLLSPADVAGLSKLELGDEGNMGVRS